MPADHRPQGTTAAPAQTPATTATSKGIAKYTNKDGSKFITVPKVNPSGGSPQASPPLASSSTGSKAPPPASNPLASPAPPINRKKQKRRAKAAAKAAQSQGAAAPNDLPNQSASSANDPHLDDLEADYSDDEDDDQYSGGHDAHQQLENGLHLPASKSRKSKKKKKNNQATEDASSTQHHHHNHHHHDHPPQQAVAHRGSGISKEKIWNTSSQEERERIKEFWLGLGEDERKSLVKVEKDAVLKKMKEQQKHTCSCTVCGRKRTAIEEELEGLYDAYYEELEQFANHPNHQADGPPLLGNHRSLAGLDPMTAGLRPSRGLPSNYAHQPSHGRIVEHVGDDEVEEGDAEYSEDELEEDDYSDEEPSEELHRADYATDFFNFGNSLTVQGRDSLPMLPSFLQSGAFAGSNNDAYGSLGGILTVADDLLKNDGKKFIEMMEQLAERRMAREEDVKEQYIRGYNTANGSYGGHNHPPPEDDEFDEDEEEYEEDDEEDYDSQEEEDTMTEEQRMEEGRRMFQIFAARMFEQRVLTAYREKVAKERQQKLLEELEEESRLDSQRKAKKAKDAQKRKDKAAKKKEALAEEKARKDAEKAAEEEARLAQEALKAEEQRLKAEEKRKKKESLKKAEEEERLRKEAERQRRVHEQKEKQAEQERKVREAKEREKNAREEARIREKEAKDRKERETRDRRDQQEKAKREQEAHKKERESKAKADREAAEKQKQEERAAQKAAALAAAVPITLPKRPAQHAVSAALPSVSPTAFASPKVPVATPALPKAAMPMRPRQASQQDNRATGPPGFPQSGSVSSQNPSSHPVTPVHTSPGPGSALSKTGSTQGSNHQPSQATSPISTTSKTVPVQPTSFNMPPMNMQFTPPGMPQAPPGFGSRIPPEPPFNPFGGGFRGQGMMPMPPGLNGLPAGRGFPGPMPPPPGFSQPMEVQFGGLGQIFSKAPGKDASQSHSRHSSAGFDGSPSTQSSTQPIGRPAPIGRPGTVIHGQYQPSDSVASGRHNVDFEDRHLGSSALLDDLDDPLHEFGTSAPRRTHAATGPQMSFPQVPFGMDQIFAPGHNMWAPSASGQSNLFSPPPPPGFGSTPGPAAWGQPAQQISAFGAQGGIGRPNQPRAVVIRNMLCSTCKELSNSEGANAGYIPLETIKVQVDMRNGGEPVTEEELLDICETEGNASNGGGSFDVRRERQSGKVAIRWVSGGGQGSDQSLQRAVGAAPGQHGEIGSSPVIGSGAFPGSRSR